MVLGFASQALAWMEECSHHCQKGLTVGFSPFEQWSGGKSTKSDL
jgi:hypothetical protein